MQDLLLLLNGRNKSIPAAARFSFSQSHYSVNGAMQTFGDLFTTTRATKAWDIDNGEMIEYAANEPILNSRGVWVGEAVTNELLKSNEFALATTQWTGGGTFSVSTATSIGSGLTAYKHTGLNAANPNRSQVSGTLTGNPETTSIIVEDIDVSETWFGFYDSTAAAWVALAKYIWSTGVISIVSEAAGSGVTVGETELSAIGPNGGRLVELSVTATPDNAGNNRQVRLFLVGPSANTDEIILHHAQHTETGYAHPPILTDASTFTKNADVIVSNAAIAPWYNQSEGTIFVESNTRATSGEAVAAQLDDGTANDRHVIKYDLSASPDELDAQTFDGGVSQALVTLSSADVVDGNRTAYAYKINDFEAATDGTSTGTDVSGTLPTVNTLRAGCDSAASYLNGYIQEFRYYNTRLPQAQMLTITG